MKELKKEVTSLALTLPEDSEIVEYFTALANNNGIEYQVLIKDALKYVTDKKLEPVNVWKKRIVE